ncbi:MAG: hypothetical protein RR681_06905 [Lachnospiraceae bacterium]
MKTDFLKELGLEKPDLIKTVQQSVDTPKDKPRKCMDEYEDTQMYVLQSLL